MKIGRGDSAVSAWTGTETHSLLNQARPAEKGQLKIVKVDPMIMRFRRDDKGGLGGNFCLICRIETDDGIVGWGEGTNFPKVAPIAAEIDANKSWLLGQSAFDIEKIWYTLYRGRNAMHGGSVQSAISAIDIALWDIVGSVHVRSERDQPGRRRPQPVEAGDAQDYQRGARTGARGDAVTPHTYTLAAAARLTGNRVAFCFGKTGKTGLPDFRQ